MAVNGNRRQAPGASWLIAGGILSALAALAHASCIVFGPSWYRFFGAPESMIVALEQGDHALDWLTVGISLILAIWAAYAFSGAGLIRRLPLLRTGLCVISAIYLLRGLMIVPTVFIVPYPEGAFDYWSSLIVLGYGIVYALGTWKSWPALRPTR